jgi:glycosyltransferase involved in cell wall biosynthesis
MMTDNVTDTSQKFMKKIPKAAVVISTYNRPRALQLVLLGLSRQLTPPSQIVIGDDGSGDETQQVINHWRQSGLPIEHCWHSDDGYRKTIIMNRAVSRVKEPLTIFLDGDCIPSPMFVADHIRLHAPNVINAGPRILADRRLTAELEAAGNDIWFNRGSLSSLQDRVKGRINRLLPLISLPDGSWRNRSPQKWQLVRGCNFSVATEAVWQVDGFEESLYGWGPDDSDIAVRLINSGLRVKSARFACPVLHLWHKEESRHGLDRNRSYLRSAIAERRTKAVVGLSSHGLRRPTIDQ